MSKTTTRTYKRRLLKWLETPVTDSERDIANTWYMEAQTEAQNIANGLDTTLEVGACIIAAFSPRNRWSKNIEYAHNYERGIPVPGLSMWTTMADASVVHGFDALRGPKTNAFARNIAGDHDAVTIDVWMARAAGLSDDTPTIVQYRRVSDAVRSIAKQFDMTPAAMQALIWCRIRGKAE